MIIWKEGEVQSGKRRWARAEKKEAKTTGEAGIQINREGEGTREKKTERDKK